MTCVRHYQVQKRRCRCCCESAAFPLLICSGVSLAAPPSSNPFANVSMPGQGGGFGAFAAAAAAAAGGAKADAGGGAPRPDGASPPSNEAQAASLRDGGSRDAQAGVGADESDKGGEAASRPREVSAAGAAPCAGLGGFGGFAAATQAGGFGAFAALHKEGASDKPGEVRGRQAGPAPTAGHWPCGPAPRFYQHRVRRARRSSGAPSRWILATRSSPASNSTSPRRPRRPPRRCSGRPPSPHASAWLLRVPGLRECLPCPSACLVCQTPCFRSVSRRGVFATSCSWVMCTAVTLCHALSAPQWRPRWWRRGRRARTQCSQHTPSCLSMASTPSGTRGVSGR